VTAKKFIEVIVECFASKENLCDVLEQIKLMQKDLKSVLINYTHVILKAMSYERELRKIDNVIKFLP
jgi:hypothetical protein